jgi:hypothetical protein
MLMARFDPARYASPVAALLAEPRLTLDAGVPNRAAFDRLRALDEARLCDGHPVRDTRDGPRLPRGALAVPRLLDESHRVSQSLHGREGSYWHGIMHRREGDYPNAKYWFRRVGAHPIHEALGRSARTLAQEAAAGGASIRASGAWDPAGFVDLCTAACSGQSGAADLCQRIQEHEWQLLFDYCYRRAIGRADDQRPIA